ncbi:N-acetylglucosaminyl-phosphatidylinositol de-N-acetylase [Elasticomyces elasticus]|nr:N-acetylglucosaminyl-phosphatidylinositol de-N-acetylase [Elasticomyces elasticus]
MEFTVNPALGLQIFALIIVIWLFTWYMTWSFPTLQGKRICLLIAHPDDEAMFFAPTVQWLTRPALGNQVLILCLSSGDADGLGHVRKEELRKSALMLGVKSSEHVVVIEDAKLPDSMTADWDPKLIASILTGYFAPTVASGSTTAAPQVSLDAIITFDKQGYTGLRNDDIDVYMADQRTGQFSNTIACHERTRGREGGTEGNDDGSQESDAVV